MAQVRYIVKDVSESIVFYETYFQFGVVEQYGEAMAILRRDDLDLWLAGPTASASRPLADGRAPEPGGWCRIVLPVSDIERTADELKRGGVAFRSQIVKGPGGSQVLCEDPSGNPIELFQAR